MERGKHYVLFLSANADGSYGTTGGPQGIYVIPTDGKGIRVHSGRGGDPVWRSRDMDVRPFLKQIRQALQPDKKK
ncbi:MAG: hypothetical protein H0T60_02205 [Acidobacteria bacterium]|nr:hypothetical protein [Acidobacteriota bacterium]